MSVIVISAVNITEAGPLSVLRECLRSAADRLPTQYTIIALVNSNLLIDEPRVQLEVISSAKTSWFHRMYWEWFGFCRISRRLRPELWLSLHDITPRLVGCRQAVYCHNPSPFYSISLQETFWSPAFFLYNRFYFCLYRIMIRRNQWIIVQQSWIRNAFLSRISTLPIVVSHPSISIPASKVYIPSKGSGNKIFLYPALPRVFKNIQTLCHAANNLVRMGLNDFEVILTVSGLENSYSKFLYSSFSSLPQIQFLGIQTPAQMSSLYSDCDVVVFPSKLETWGLPITEAKAFAKPLLLADLPYAHETAGDYPLVSFFPPESSEYLASLMAQIIQGSWKPSGSHSVTPAEPFTSNWNSLWELLTSS